MTTWPFQLSPLTALGHAVPWDGDDDDARCAATASAAVAETPSPSAETTDVSDSGPRLLAITTAAAGAAVRPRAIAWPSRLPAPMMPTGRSTLRPPSYSEANR